MHLWDKKTLKSLLVPGGVLLSIVAVVLHGGFLSASVAGVQFFYYAAFTAGILLGWRFRSSRAVMVLLTLLLAERAIGFFSGTHGISAGPGRAAFEMVALLLPLNFILVSSTREHGFTFPPVSAGLALLFAESVLVTLVAPPGVKAGPAFLHFPFWHHPALTWTRIPELALLVFAAALVILLIRSLRYRRPVESGFLWALGSAFLALQTGALGRIPSAYIAASALILASAIVEGSYFMAFHDELTTLPARRAFNQALLGLPESYAIAAVDVDHFKKFNDTFGHETGDQVLRMVSSKLARVSGGGEAFRVGGEEFSILFRGKSAKDAVSHLELLRHEIEESVFRVRSEGERRTTSRGPDRRKAGSARRKLAVVPRAHLADGNVSVTVSIGVAESSVRRREPAQVMEAADKALYKAKQAGRNRVEIASLPRSRKRDATQKSLRVGAGR